MDSRKTPHFTDISAKTPLEKPTRTIHDHVEDGAGGHESSMEQL